MLARGERLLEVRDLTKHFAVPREGLFGVHRVVHAVDGVDLDVAQGETVGLVGESGCGKSTLARVLVRIYEPTSGSIVFAGQDIGNASPAAIRPLRRRMQMVFQDPYSSLNPRMTVGEILGEPMRFHGIAAGPADTAARIAELLDVVGLSAKAAARYPHEFSGGQRQRISIARALAVRPDFIIADEPISALDVNIQAQIINLLADLQERFGLTYLFIAHDLAVVRHISNRIVVLYLGKVMEVAPAEELFLAPLHPYTRHLISAVPIPDAAVERRRQHLRSDRRTAKCNRSAVRLPVPHSMPYRPTDLRRADTTADGAARRTQGCLPLSRKVLGLALSSRIIIKSFTTSLLAPRIAPNH